MNRKQLLLAALVAFVLIGVSGCGGQAVSTGGDHTTFYYFWAKW